MLFSMTSCAIVWVGMTAATATYAKDATNTAAAQASIVSRPRLLFSYALMIPQAMIFLFGMVYSVGLTPLQALYPVEVLSFEMRAKGMAFSSLSVSVGGLLNQFAWPVSLKAIGWKTYIIFSKQKESPRIVTLYLTILQSCGTSFKQVHFISSCQRPRVAVSVAPEERV